MQATASPAQDGTQPPALRVLLIDGNEESLILCLKVMGRRGHQASAASTGMEGFRLARSQPFDAIVLTSRLPDISGFDLLKSLREHVPEVPIVVVVPAGAEDAALKALAGGAATYVIKSPRYHELLPSVVEEQAEGVRTGRRLELEQKARAKLAEELLGSEARLRVLAEQAPIILWTVDKDLRFTSGTGAGMDSVGITPGTLLGASLEEYFKAPDADYPPVAAHRKALQGEASSYDFDWAGRTFEVHVGPLRSSAGDIVGAVGAALDVTEKRMAEEEARRSEERFVLLGRATHDIAWDWDIRTDAVWQNEAVSKTLGYAPEEVEPVGAWWDSLVHPDDREQGVESLRRAIESGQTYWTAEYRIRRKDGSYATVLERGFVIRDPAGTPLRMVGSTMDISERRRREEVQRALYRISEAAVAAKDLDSLYDTIHTIIAGLMPAENFYIALVDPDSHTLNFPYFLDEEESKPEPQAIGGGLTEYVIRTGQALLVTPSVFDGMVARGEVKSVGPPSIDWVGVPLVARGETLGALVVQTYKEGVRYTDEDRQILEFVSGQIATAIDRRRTEETLRRREAILEAVRFASDEFLRAPRWQERIPDVLGRLGEAAGVSRVWIYRNVTTREGEVRTREAFEWCAPGIPSFVDPDSRPSRSYRERGFGRWEDTLGHGDIIVGHTKDFPESERAGLTAQDIHSIVVVPIFSSERWWGSMGFDQCHQPRQWTLPEVDALKTAAGTVGAAIARSEAEGGLQNVQRQLSAVVGSVPIVVWSAAPDGTIRFMEGKGLEPLGIRPAEVLGRRSEDVFGGSVPGLEKRLKRSLRGESSREEIHLGRLVFDVFYGPLRNSEGEIIGTLGVGMDITDNKEAERALRESEERYRVLFEANPQPMWVYDSETLRFLAVNEAAVQHYGYTREEFLTMSVKDIRPVEDVPRFLTAIRGLRAGIELSGEWRHRRKDGSSLDVEVVSHGVTFGNRPARLVLLTDVTARKEVQSALARSERRFRTLFETSADGIVLMDRHGVIVDVNPAGEAIAGVPRGSLVGKRIVELLPEAEREPVRAFGRAILKGEPGPNVREVRYRVPDGRWKTLEIRSRAVQDPGHEPLQEAVVRDVTEARDLQRRLLETERLASMGQIAGYVAHEINNPLANISLLAASIQRRTKDEEILGKLEKINEQRRHAAAIIADILSFSKQRGIETVETDLRTVMETAAEQTEPLRPAAVRLDLRLGDDPVPARVDILQMQEVFTNLLKNAYEATTSGSVVVELLVHPSQLEVRVADTGTGVEPAILDRVFEPFVTTKRKSGGTGLGLALVKSVVTAHGGDIACTSVPGRGATFTVTLPRRDADEDPRRG